MNKLSVVLATYNEEKNIGDCLEAIKDIASEIVIVDGSSIDRTVEIVKKFGARVLLTDNPPIFHINKQKAIDMAKNEWILQLDADERITKDLSKEIVKITKMNDEQLEEYENNLPDRRLFLRHQKLIEERDGRVGDKIGCYNAFFIPRRNFFLGRYLKYGGTYPDPAIRLIRKGKAYLPCKDVHEQMQVTGRVGWLQNYMLHIDSPTFSRYLERNNRYTELIADELKLKKIGVSIKNFVSYMIIKPIWWFLMTYIRHKGFKDGLPGFVFSLFSSFRFAIAYIKYWSKDENE